MERGSVRRREIADHDRPGCKPPELPPILRRWLGSARGRSRHLIAPSTANAMPSATVRRCSTSTCMRCCVNTCGHAFAHGRGPTTLSAVSQPSPCLARRLAAPPAPWGRVRRFGFAPDEKIRSIGVQAGIGEIERGEDDSSYRGVAGTEMTARRSRVVPLPSSSRITEKPDNLYGDCRAYT